jgi:hypothetical protein
MDPSVQKYMTREKTDTVLKVLVKHFFIEKEVTSTLVMDSLYSGLKALEYQTKNKKGVPKLAETVQMDIRSTPMVLVDQDMFVLADDVILLLERAALDTLPHQPLPTKDDKSSQNRTKDGSSGDDFNKDSIERDDKRLVELGWKTLEFFALAHIFSRIEVAYQEAVALKRQEELIREEEAAGLAEIELKAKRSAAEKEKRIRKKQVCFSFLCNLANSCCLSIFFSCAKFDVNYFLPRFTLALCGRYFVCEMGLSKIVLL